MAKLSELSGQYREAAIRLRVAIQDRKALAAEGDRRAAGEVVLLRQMLGEMRDLETMEVAMTAAETGELLFSTLHTTGAASTVDRIIDSFPPNQQAQVRIQLSMVLQAVISQQMVPTTDGGQTVAFEVMITNPAIKNLIREAKTHQIDNAIAAGSAEGMCTMDSSLLNLFQKGRITRETALTYSVHYEALDKRMRMR